MRGLRRREIWFIVRSLDRYGIATRTLTPDFTSERTQHPVGHGGSCVKHRVCVEDGSRWGSCQRSSPPLPLCTPPDRAHRAQSSSRTLTLRQYTACCAAPLLPSLHHLHTAPPRSPAARLVRSPRPGWRARHMRAKRQLSPPRPPRRCMRVRSACARPCSSHLRCGGTSSLPQAHGGENGARAAAMWADVGVVW